jgi:hypothetical protein
VDRNADVSSSTDMIEALVDEDPEGSREAAYAYSGDEMMRLWAIGLVAEVRRPWRGTFEQQVAAVLTGCSAAVQEFGSRQALDADRRVGMATTPIREVGGVATGQ